VTAAASASQFDPHDGEVLNRPGGLEAVGASLVRRLKTDRLDLAQLRERETRMAGFASKAPLTRTAERIEHPAIGG
jgi:hypothetical protein